LQQCSQCEYIIVKNGAIAGLDLDGSRLRRIYLAGGSVHQFDARRREVPLAFPNAYARQLGAFRDNPGLSSLTRERFPIRGLIVKGDLLQGVITSLAELQPFLSRSAAIHVLGESAMAAFAAVSSGGKVLIVGEGFAPNLHGENPLQLSLDGRVILDSVKVDVKGLFRAEAQVNKAPGLYELAAEQREGKRLTREKTTLNVIVHDTAVPTERPQ
jgi:hypothetical protein